MTDSDQSGKSGSESDSHAGAKVVVSVVIILAGMGWFLTYDWPSGKEVGLADFVMFWLRELLILGVVLAVLVAMAFRSIRSKMKAGGEK